MRLVELSVNQSLMTITRSWKQERDFLGFSGECCRIVLVFGSGTSLGQSWGPDPRKRLALPIFCVVDYLSVSVCVFSLLLFILFVFSARVAIKRTYVITLHRTPECRL